MQCSIVAELSCNHNGSFEKAVDLISAAKNAGANAVKIQVFTPSEMTLDCDNENFVVPDGKWKGTLYSLYEKARTPLHWLKDLMDTAHQKNLSFITSVYHPKSLEITELFKVQIYKISSFELNYTDLLVSVAKTNKPIILSTGMATEDEIKKAIETITKYNPRLALLKCTSKYPAPMTEMNLITIPAMAMKYGLPVGLSDHTRGITAPIVATVYGASVIEKHLCLDRNCLDGEFSITPNRFKKMVQSIRLAEESIGEVKYGGKTQFRRSMVAIKDIKKNSPLTDENTGCFRTVIDGAMDIGLIAEKDYKTGDLI